MRSIFLSMVTTLCLAACGTGQSTTNPLKVTVRGVTYEIPKDQVVASAGNWPFVRVAPPSAGFHLILDGRHPYEPNKLGDQVPTISRINDNRYGSAEVLKSGGVTVVCERLRVPHFTCGLDVVDHGVKWGVIFDRADLAQAAKMKSQAVAAIASYRR